PGLPGTGLRVSDPSVAYDAGHGTWLVASETVARGRAALVVSRSAAGSNWLPPVTVTKAQLRFLPYDKPWVACDAAGTCYLAYTDFVRRQLSVQRSLDG